MDNIIKSDDEDPLVSVTIITYNRASSIKECINSILSQNYSNLEIIVVDDGSTDHTSSIVKNMTDSRIRYYPNDKNRGINFSRNRALELSKGIYIAVLDSDDYAMENKIKTQVEYLKRNPEVSLIASYIEIQNEQGQLLAPWDLDRQTVTEESIKATLWKQNCIAHSSVMYVRETVSEYGYHSGYASEDYDLWLNLVSDGYHVRKLPQALTKYTVSEDSATKEQDEAYNYLDKTRRIKKEYLKRRILKKKWTLYDFKIFYWVAASYIPLLRHRFN